MNSVKINGREHKIDNSLHEKTLLYYLREELGLTGTKNGCGKGVCGACTVLIDGRAKKSCVITLAKVTGKSIITIEGVPGDNGELHPLQQAFIDAGAIQCGFCTPGMIMKGLDLLNRNPDPSREEIRKAYNSNLCRCTGYQQIIDAVETGAKRMIALKKGLPDK